MLIAHFFAVLSRCTFIKMAFFLIRFESAENEGAKLKHCCLLSQLKEKYRCMLLVELAGLVPNKFFYILKPFSMTGCQFVHAENITFSEPRFSFIIWSFVGHQAATPCTITLIIKVLHENTTTWEVVWNTLRKLQWSLHYIIIRLHLLLVNTLIYK